jgi:hypothetical protein
VTAQAGSEPLTDEELWCLPPEDMPDPSGLEAEDGWCLPHDTRCTFWLVNYSHTGCVLQSCKYWPGALINNQ